MKLARFNGGRIGVVRDREVFDVSAQLGAETSAFPPVDMIRLIANFHHLKPILETSDCAGIPLNQVELEAPVVWPNKLIAMPGNFRDHLQEMINVPKVLHARGFFLKAPSALCGADQPIILPELPGREIHHEAELGIVIGRECRFVPRSAALDYIFGYACAMDITVRDNEVDRVLRKSYDTFAPFGPWLVTSDEVGDTSALDMKLWVGDELRQHANMRDLLLDVPGMIELTSSVMTLYPGDIIFAGTPAGVGQIRGGDRITIDIERVGRMSVVVKQGKGGNNSAFEGYEPVFEGTHGRLPKRQ